MRQFNKLDRNGDGRLDREEMRNIIEKTNKQAANQQAGESGEDFYNTLDRNSDNFIDKEEYVAFLEAAAKMAGGTGATWAAADAAALPPSAPWPFRPR